MCLGGVRRWRFGDEERWSMADFSRVSEGSVFANGEGMDFRRVWWMLLLVFSRVVTGRLARGWLTRDGVFPCMKEMEKGHLNRSSGALERKRWQLDCL